MTISFFQILLLLLPLLVIVPPLVKILQKAGFSGWWVIAGFAPFVNLIALWVFAFSKWPNQASA